jgi:hypothetical protein
MLVLSVVFCVPKHHFNSSVFQIFTVTYFRSCLLLVLLQLPKVSHHFEFMFEHCICLQLSNLTCHI